jgi:protein-tyrosine phosphatase
MAEGLLNSMVSTEVGEGAEAGEGPAIVAESAGTHTADDYPASTAAVEICQAHGVDIRAHGSRQVTPEILGAADLILTMEARHRAMVLAWMPECAGRVFTLADFAGEEDAGDVPDPIGGDASLYARAYGQIASLLQKAWPEIRARAAQGG